MIDPIWQFISYLFTFVAVVAIIEIILSVRWSRIYFTAGIPIYRRKITVRQDAGEMPDAPQIETALSASGKRAPMLVRRVGANCLAFREKLFYFGIGYSPVMRGVVKSDPASGKVEVIGLLNWYLLLFVVSFLLFLLISPFDSSGIIIALCMAVLLAYIYWMQKKRFREVEDAVLKLWNMSQPD